MFDFFNGRRTLEDPRKKVVLLQEEYEKLLEDREALELLSEKFKELALKNKALEEEMKLLKSELHQIDSLKQEKQEVLNSLIRAKADLENYKKLIERQNNNYKLQATTNILKKIISHHDDLVRAVKNVDSQENGIQVKKGFEMVIKNLEKILIEENVIPMNCEGEKFDPYKQEVLMVREEDEIPENTILEELEKGYFYHGEVLRPARVVISKKPTTISK